MGYIKAMEERLNMRLIERQVGGKYGGGAVLSEDARTFLNKYEALESGINVIVGERFNKIFKVNGCKGGTYV